MIIILRICIDPHLKSRIQYLNEMVVGELVDSWLKR